MPYLIDCTGGYLRKQGDLQVSSISPINQRPCCPMPHTNYLFIHITASQVRIKLEFIRRFLFKIVIFSVWNENLKHISSGQSLTKQINGADDQKWPQFPGKSLGLLAVRLMPSSPTGKRLGIKRSWNLYKERLIISLFSFQLCDSIWAIVFTSCEKIIHVANNCVIGILFSVRTGNRL